MYCSHETVLGGTPDIPRSIKLIKLDPSTRLWCIIYYSSDIESFVVTLEFPRNWRSSNAVSQLRVVPSMALGLRR